MIVFLYNLIMWRSGGRGSKSILTYNSHLYILYFPLASMRSKSHNNIPQYQFVSRKGKLKYLAKKIYLKQHRREGNEASEFISSCHWCGDEFSHHSISGEKQREELLFKLFKSGLVLIDGKVPLGGTLVVHLHPVRGKLWTVSIPAFWIFIFLFAYLCSSLILSNNVKYIAALCFHLGLLLPIEIMSPPVCKCQKKISWSILQSVPCQQWPKVI